MPVARGEDDGSRRSTYPIGPRTASA